MFPVQSLNFKFLAYFRLGRGGLCMVWNGMSVSEYAGLVDVVDIFGY
jgi:hypothetical protein